jgi:cardiolipin synthase
MAIGRVGGRADVAPAGPAPEKTEAPPAPASSPTKLFHAAEDVLERAEKSVEQGAQSAVAKARTLLATGGRALGHLEDFAKMLASAPFKPPLDLIAKADPTTGPLQPGLSAATSGNSLVPFVDGAAFREQLLGHIDSAQKSIWLNVYEWQDNAQGQEVVAALERAKARGVDIHLVVDNRDSSGEFSPKSSAAVQKEPLMQRLAKTGDLRFVDHDAFRVNHRKVAIFDGKEAMAMGMNIGANYMLPREAGWTYHDAGVVVAGPAVRDLAAVFANSYEATGGPKLTLPDRLPPQSGVPNDGAKVQVIQHAFGDRNIERELIERIDASKDNIVLANGFAMEKDIYGAVLRARARGVKVTLLFGEAGPNTTIMAERRFDDLRKAGVNLQQINSPEHLKAYQFDDTYTMVGSSNLDGSSNWRNDEVMLLVSSKDFAKQFYDQAFAPELATSKPITVMPRPVTTSKDRAIQDILGPLLDG